MEYLFYCIPGIPVPAVTLGLFVLAAVLFFLFKASALGNILYLVLITVGVAIGLISNCDLTLLAALISGALCVYLLVTRCFYRVGKGAKK